MKVYVKETGIRGKDDTINSTSYSREQIAQRLNIPIDRVKETSSDLLMTGDGFVKVSSYKILPEDSQATPQNMRDYLYEYAGDAYENFKTWFASGTTGQSSTFGYKTQSSRSGTYKVKAGDSLWRIAKEFGTSVEVLLKLLGNEKYI